MAFSVWRYHAVLEVDVFHLLELTIWTVVLLYVCQICHFIYCILYLFPSGWTHWFIDIPLCKSHPEEDWTGQSILVECLTRANQPVHQSPEGPIWKGEVTTNWLTLPNMAKNTKNLKNLPQYGKELWLLCLPCCSFYIPIHTNNERQNHWPEEGLNRIFWTHLIQPQS